MKTNFITLLLLLAMSTSLRAGPEAEKAFMDKYKTAFESKDATTLHSLLYTQGSDPGIVEFYKMMQAAEIGGKITKIELVALSSEEMKKASGPQDSPNGGKVCLTLKPTRKLVFSVEQKSDQGSSTSTTENMIAEKNGKFVIPVPGPCK